MDLKSPLLSKAKSMVSSLSSIIILWSTGSPLLSPTFPNPKPFSSLQQDHMIMGLKTLIYTETETTNYHPQRHTSRVPKPASSSPPPPPPKTAPFSHSSAAMDDLIGTDSGAHMVPTSSSCSDDQTTNTDEKRRRSSACSRIRDKRRRHERYPPPMRELIRRRTTPFWEWTRHCRDGRLVLEARLVERREYLEARREEGRLVLNIVSISEEDHHGSEDNEVKCECECDYHMKKQFGGLGLESGSGDVGACRNAYGIFMESSMMLCNSAK